MQKKLLLFGGTGFVGSNVARKALLRGYTVVIATRGGVPDAGSPLEALARRAKVVGGRTAALEATKLGAVGLASEAPIPSVTPEEVASGSARHGPSSEARNEEQSGLVDYARGATEGESALSFVGIDASSRQQVFHFMNDHPDATAVVSAVGLLTRNYEDARQSNGDANTNIAAGICHEKLMPAVSKFVYVSAEPYNTYMPRTVGSRRLLKGYFCGKRIAERAVLDNMAKRGVVLRPGFIYGTRFLSVPSATNEAGTVIPIPLGLIGKPLDVLLSAVGGTKVFTPPVDVDVVAETTVRALEWADIPEKDISGIVDVHSMKRICRMEDPTLQRAAATTT